MDIVSHAITGALINASFFHPHLRNKAAILGAVGACLPDLDVLIRSPSDPLLVLEYHRHFTHSLAFAPIAAALAALLVWPLLRARISTAVLYCALLAGYVSACLLDVFTSYGTYLLWPFVQRPIALNMIAVVDPLFTLLISLGLYFALSQRAGIMQLRYFGAVAAAVYLCIAAVQLHRAENATRQWAESKNLDSADILVKPTLGNVLLWRGLIRTADEIHAAGVRPGLLETQIYPGDGIQRVTPEDVDLPGGSRALRDLKRFNGFSEGYLVRFPGDQPEFGDVRYAMLPTSTVPLWGIRINRDEPDGDTQFFTRRDTASTTRQRFLHMLAGRPVRDTLPP